jgi:ubiquinone/menaquinone biosynthesis C-methylase UbiE
MYESGSLGRATGGILRPGGWALTERLLAHCGLHAGDRVLDVGCGGGYTLRYLVENYAVQAIGVDRSDVLLHQGHTHEPGLSLARAWGMALPVADAQVDVVLSECSLSAMSGIDDFMAEAWRVLRPGGRLAISDVYVRNPDGATLLRSLPLTCGGATLLHRQPSNEACKSRALKSCFGRTTPKR